MATDAEESGFLSRWARRKAQVREGAVVDEVRASPPVASPAIAPTAIAPTPVMPIAEPATTEPVQDQPLAPTLADVAALNRDSDYRRFVASGVDPEVKNAALGKLFSDPHFNVMDGLDIYIDDYGKPDPLPASMLRQMVQSRFLGLFDDEDEPTDPALTAAGPPAHNLAPSHPAIPSSSPAPLPNENADLRLQPHDAAGHRGHPAGPGKEPGRTH